jgi:hypothetical protein
MTRPLDRSVAVVLSGWLRTLLDRVPDGYREALELTDLGGLTQGEAAGPAWTVDLGQEIPGAAGPTAPSR